MRRRKLKQLILIFATLLALPAVLFVINGTLLTPGNDPVITARLTEELPSTSDQSPRRIKVLAYNIAKAFAHEGGYQFATEDAVQKRLGEMAELIQSEDPDIVFLSEVLRECGPCPVNQLAVLAEKAGFPYTAYGENYTFGIPFFKVAGGNAILSKTPLDGIDNLDLHGRQPFWVTSNNRRVLFCSTKLGGNTVLLGAIHNDSRSGPNNLAQTKQILNWIGDRPAVLGGDFNADPGEPSIDLFRNSNRWSGRIEGKQTFPSTAPNQKLDYVFAPATWKLSEHQVIDSELSDHKPVVSTFEIP
ncbi:MAG: endonuclease/exonuclease/phosphatase family protein [Planctomycetaceae bacterium]